MALTAPEPACRNEQENPPGIETTQKRDICRVVKLVDGDTFDIALQDYNSSQVAEDVIRIRLADIDTPEVRGSKAWRPTKSPHIRKSRLQVILAVRSEIGCN